MNFRKSNGELVRLKALAESLVRPPEEQLAKELAFLKEQLQQANERIQELLKQLDSPEVS